VKALLRIFRPSRKLVIVIGGTALFIGASGGVAVYIGRDNIIGQVLEEANGVSCTDVNLVTIKKQDRVWIRKYIKTEPTDGMTRVKTALRVAQAIYAQERPDLVQVVVLDENVQRCVRIFVAGRSAPMWFMSRIPTSWSKG
jgi:hypothetical protein